MNDKSTEIIKATEEDFIQWLSEKGSEKLIEGMFFDPRSISVHEHIISNSEKLKKQVNQLYFSSYWKISTGKKNSANLWKAGWQSDGCIKSLPIDKKGGEDIAIVEFKGMQNNYLKHNDIAKLFQYLYYAGEEKVKLLWICRGSMAEDIKWIYSMLKKSDDPQWLDTFLKTCGTWASKPHINGPCLKCTEAILKEKQSWQGNKKGKLQAKVTVGNEQKYTLTNFEGRGKSGAYKAGIFKTKTRAHRKKLLTSFKLNLIIVSFDEESDTQHNHPSDIEMISLKQLYKTGSGPFVKFMKEYLDHEEYNKKRQSLRRCQH